MKEGLYDLKNFCLGRSRIRDSDLRIRLSGPERNIYGSATLPRNGDFLLDLYIGNNLRLPSYKFLA